MMSHPPLPYVCGLVGESLAPALPTIKQAAPKGKLDNIFSSSNIIGQEVKMR
jgi:hypothetical protein